MNHALSSSVALVPIGRPKRSEPSPAVRLSTPAARPSNATPAQPLCPTIFHEDWWLDAATHGRFSEVTVRSGGRTVGRLPYLRQSMLGLSECILPPLTPFLGPAVDEGLGRPSRREHRRRVITQELIEQLPTYSRFHQRLHAGCQDTLPFVEQKFESRAEFTFEVAPGTEKALWEGMRDKTRNVIRRAQDQTEVIELDPEQFSRLYTANLQHRGKLFNYMWRHEVDTLLHAAIERRRGMLIGARDASGQIGSAIFVVWDETTSYLLLTTRTPQAGNGDVSRLIWEAMIDAGAHGRVFDFGGVGTNGSVLFYSGFGGAVSTRFAVERANPLFRALDLTMRKSRSLKNKLLFPITDRLQGTI